jgi:hypothetical protein
MARIGICLGLYTEAKKIEEKLRKKKKSPEKKRG